jgi:hypothetical protein
LPATHGERYIKLFTASALPERNQTLQLRQIEPSKVRFPRSAAERASLFPWPETIRAFFLLSGGGGSGGPLSVIDAIDRRPATHRKRRFYCCDCGISPDNPVSYTPRTQKKNPILKTGVKQENSPAIIVRRELYGVAVLFFAPLGLLKQTDYQQLLFFYSSLAITHDFDSKYFRIEIYLKVNLKS